MADRIALTFDLAVKGDVKKRLTEVETELAAINQQMREARKLGQTDVYGKLKVQQEGLKNESKQLRAEIRDQIRAFQAAKFPEDSLIGLRRRYTELRREVNALTEEQRRSDFGQNLIRQAEGVKQKIDQIGASVRDFRSNVGNYEEAVRKGVGNIADLFTTSAAAAAGALGFGALLGGFDALGEGIGKVQQIAEDFARLRGEVQRLTGATGPALDEFTVKVDALAGTFEKDTGEILTAANALTKQLTGDFSQSLELIRAGFLAGGDASGELLDTIREYSPFFKEAGLSGEQFIRLISTSVREGVFSDKGADAIKEATLRLRELPTATRAALQAIGLTSEEITRLIESEGVGAAISAVSTRLSEFKDDAPQVGQALADIFGGPGEDAGIRFVKSLSSIDAGITDLIDPTNELTRLQLQQLDLNERLATAQNDLSRELAGTSQTLQQLGQRVLITVLETLVRIIEAFRAAPAFVRENKTELAALGVALLAFNAQAIAAAANSLRLAAAQRAQTIAARASVVATNLLNAALRVNPIALVVTAVGLLVAGFSAAYRRSETLRAGIAGLGAVAREVFTIVKEAVASFVSGFEQLRQGNFRAAFEDIKDAVTKSNPIGVAFTQGQRLKEAFLTGFRDRQAREAIDRESEQIKEGIEQLRTDATREASAAGEQTGQALAEGINRGLDKAIAVNESLAAVSLAALKKQVAELRSEIEQADPGDENAIRDKLRQIVALEGQIQGTEDVVKRIENELRGIDSSPLDIAAPAPGQGADAPESELETALADIELRKQQAIAAALAVAGAREDATDRIRRIEIAAEAEILRARIQGEELSTAQRLALQNELAQKEIQLEQQKVAEKLRLNQQLARSIQSAFSQVSGAVLTIERNRSEQTKERQLSDLEQEYARRLELAEGDAATQEELKADLEAKKAKIEAESARRRKDIAVKEAIIQGALAIIEALPDPFRVALAAITAGLQLAVIRSQSFDAGGLVGKGKGSALPLLDALAAMSPALSAGRITHRANIRRQPGGDNVLATVRRGEVLLNAKQQAALKALAGGDIFRRIGVPGFQEGGLVGATTPQIVRPARAGAGDPVITVELSDAQINRLADVMAERTSTRTADGVKSAVVEANRETENRKRLNRNLSQ